MWRPDDWKNPYHGRGMWIPELKALEAGADAMLEALKNGKSCAFDEVGHLKVGFKGWLVFIPEEKE